MYLIFLANFITFIQSNFRLNLFLFQFSLQRIFTQSGEFWIFGKHEEQFLSHYFFGINVIRFFTIYLEIQ